MTDRRTTVRRVPRGASTAVAALAIVVASLAHVFVAWGSTSPVFYTDEVGYLFNAERIAGVGATPDLQGSSYYLGWSILLVPLWWVTSDPQLVYLGALVLSVACGILVIAPLSSFATSLGMRRPWAVVTASAVSVAPSRLVMSNFALAENFMALLVATSAYLAVRLARRRDARSGLLLLAVSSLLVITHARTAPVLVASVLYVIVVFWRRLRIAAIGVGMVAAITVPTFLVYRGIVNPMYPDAATSREERGLDRLFSLDPVSAFVATVGQLWYLYAAWFALALLGVIVTIRRAVGEVRSRRPGLGWWALVVLVGVLGISVVWIAEPMARGDLRLDIYMYGRYIDTVLFVFAQLGIVVLAARVRAPIAWIWAGAAVGVVGAFVLIVRPRIPTGDGVWWGPNSVAGLIQWPWPDVTTATRVPWVEASIAAAGVAVVMLLVSRWAGGELRQVVVALVLLPVFLASGLVAEVRTIRPMYDAWYGSFTLRHDVIRVLEEHPRADISFDTRGLSESLGGSDTVSRNAYQYWLTPRALPLFDSDDEQPPTQLVISRAEWPEGEAAGAVRIAVDGGLFDNALWVMPGALQDDVLAEDHARLSK